MIGNTSYAFGVYDTTADVHYERLRPLSYPMTDVFLICFSIASHESFDNVKDKWFPEVHHHRPGVACLLVGTKVDLRTDPEAVVNLAKKKQTPVTKSDGEKLAKYIGAYKYVEVSALSNDNVEGLFNEVKFHPFPAASIAS
ncbi:ras-domain-containing protein [Clavulina sp. PMI_390]|nr:ras-domain-containing protein [Clavulina sp. PMI_390]KAF8298233.1 ras-domain-containing protein [Clavulina sp. PMI_390]